MTHDPMCPSLLPYNTLEGYPCQCRLITQVREDTLAAAVQRVEALRFAEEMFEVADMYHAAISAIKGDKE
jgi:hypothetical protein